MNLNKSITERIFQAIGFEVLAILICTPLLAWIMDKPMLEMGVVTLVIAVLALAWNVVFNGLFDRVLKHFAIAHNAWMRVAHALLFEGGLVAVGVPLIAWWLKVSLWQAFCWTSACCCFSCRTPTFTTGFMTWCGSGWCLRQACES